MVILFGIAALICWVCAIAFSSSVVFAAGVVFVVGAGIIEEIRKQETRQRLQGVVGPGKVKQEKPLHGEVPPFKAN